MSLTYIEDKLKEYGFVFAVAMGSITFAGVLVTGFTGEELTRLNFLILPISVTLGYAGGRKIRDFMGKEGRDERDIENYEEGMTWGFIVFTLLAAAENGFGLDISSAIMLMYSTGVALTILTYRQIQQTGIKRLIR